ncbi:MAG: hypothetical protein N3F08_00355 [Crenarchaeota archaeon]|nr:hypothetical protein [Thermoproteota archaeon]
MSRRQFGNFTTPGSARPQELEEYLNYMRKVSEISSTIQVFSINYHYTQITNSLFSFAIGPIEFGQRERTIASIPTVLSTRLIDIIVLIVFPIVFLVVSYMVFTRRQEK